MREGKSDNLQAKNDTQVRKRVSFLTSILRWIGGA